MDNIHPCQFNDKHTFYCVRVRAWMCTNLKLIEELSDPPPPPPTSQHPHDEKPSEQLLIIPYLLGHFKKGAH